MLIVTIQDVCSIITDGTHQTPTYSESGVVFLSSTNVKSKRIDWDNVKYVSRELHLQLAQRCSPKLNDILLAKNGTTGIAAIVDRDLIFDIYVSLALLRADENKILPHYLLNIINTKIVKDQFNSRLKGMGVPNLHLIEIKGVKIPLPNFKTQQKIIYECEIIDNEYDAAQSLIDNSKKQIATSFNDIFSKADKTYKLNNSKLFEVSIGKRVVAKEIEETVKGIPVFSANVFEPFGLIDKELLKDFDKPSVLWGIDGDWMVNYIEKEKPFYPTDHCGVLRLKGNEIHPRYLALVLDKAGQEVRFSRNHRASIDRIKGLSIKAPSFEIQKQLVEKVEKLENQISEAKAVIESSAEKKQIVLDKYLK